MLNYHLEMLKNKKQKSKQPNRNIFQMFFFPPKLSLQEGSSTVTTEKTFRAHRTNIQKYLHAEKELRCCIHFLVPWATRGVVAFREMSRYLEPVWDSFSISDNWKLRRPSFCSRFGSFMPGEVFEKGKVNQTK